MNEIHGNFECPKCKYNGIIWNNYKLYLKGYFKNWICRDEYINEKLQKKYVFYNRMEKKNGIAVSVVAKLVVENAGRLF